MSTYAACASVLTSIAATSRLLLIKPNEAVAAALSRALLRQGWTVRRVATAEAGLQLQVVWAPHLVLLALDLPDMAGDKLVARLSERGGCGVLMVSGYDDDDLRRAVLKQGAHDVMSKPVRASELAAHILVVQHRFEACASERYGVLP